MQRLRTPAVVAAATAATVATLVAFEHPGDAGELATATGRNVTGERATAASEQNIIGGTVDRADPSVVMLETDSGLCTGSLIAPTVVLTAAHCVKSNIDAGTAGRGTARFGTGGDAGFVASAAVVDQFAHRRYRGGLYDGFDLGLVRIDAAPSGYEPLPYNREPLTAALQGQPIRVVGFGVSDGDAQLGAGVKREATMTLSSVDGPFVRFGGERVNICRGDSGGPLFLDVDDDGREELIAVTSFGAAGCKGESRATRLDWHLDDSLAEVIAAWTGPCAADGTCVEEGCGQFSDPDCDACGFNGVCAQECAAVDLDCPVGGASEEECHAARGTDSCTAAESGCRVSLGGRGWLAALLLVLWPRRRRR